MCFTGLLFFSIQCVCIITFSLVYVTGFVRFLKKNLVFEKCMKNSGVDDVALSDVT